MTHLVILYFSMSFSLSLCAFILIFVNYRKYRTLFFKNYFITNLLLTVFFLFVFVRTYLKIMNMGSPEIEAVFSFTHNFVFSFIILYLPILIHSILEIPIKKRVKIIFQMILGLFLISITIPYITESNIHFSYQIIHRNFFITGTLFFISIFYSLSLYLKKEKKTTQVFPMKVFFVLLFTLPQLLILIPIDIIRIYFFQTDYKISYYYTFFFYPLYNCIAIVLFYQNFYKKTKKKILIPEHFYQNFHLSEREIEVLKLLVEKKTYNQIREILCISLKTVEKHVGNIYKKTQVKNRCGLLKTLKSFRV